MKSLGNSGRTASLSAASLPHLGGGGHWPNLRASGPSIAWRELSSSASVPLNSLRQIPSPGQRRTLTGQTWRHGTSPLPASLSFQGKWLDGWMAPELRKLKWETVQPAVGGLGVGCTALPSPGSSLLRQNQGQNGRDGKGGERRSCTSHSQGF